MHSDEETFRRTMEAHTVDGEPHTVIVLRRGMGNKARVWLTLNGALKTTVCMTNREATQLAKLLDEAQQLPAR
ncbi:MAG TPA: hypothetical protein VFQ77_15770 [Pseudonocardiaceae bacterium]|jgi:K+/H+ antiporter YhaU regulatory subunit KhtT|nr:hypothetical protein [Pseudonocardiaceae bacterium]